MERYIVFVRDMAQNKEFTVVRQAKADQHLAVVEKTAQKYRFPQYTVHTAYTEQELKNVLATVERWCGPAALTQEMNRREADAAKVQQTLAQRAEWDALTQEYRQSQKSAQQGVQASSTQPEQQAAPQAPTQAQPAFTTPSQEVPQGLGPTTWRSA